MLPVISSSAPSKTVRRRPSRPKIGARNDKAKTLAARNKITVLSGSTPKVSIVSLEMGATLNPVQPPSIFNKLMYISMTHRDE
mmetsp:Transcript_32396/g.68142  ORF Transcript_32396/g.68142 Transcript_32396/m.68142 type:complete len:83 (-) Transcript_32396:289-537(-)